MIRRWTQIDADDPQMIADGCRWTQMDADDPQMIRRWTQMDADGCRDTDDPQMDAGTQMGRDADGTIVGARHASPVIAARC